MCIEFVDVVVCRHPLHPITDHVKTNKYSRMTFIWTRLCYFFFCWSSSLPFIVIDFVFCFSLVSRSILCRRRWGWARASARLHVNKKWFRWEVTATLANVFFQFIINLSSDFFLPFTDCFLLFVLFRDTLSPRVDTRDTLEGTDSVDFVVVDRRKYFLIIYRTGEWDTFAWRVINVRDSYRQIPKKYEMKNENRHTHTHRHLRLWLLIPFRFATHIHMCWLLKWRDSWMRAFGTFAANSIIIFSRLTISFIIYQQSNWICADAMWKMCERIFDYVSIGVSCAQSEWIAAIASLNKNVVQYFRVEFNGLHLRECRKCKYSIDCPTWQTDSSWCSGQPLDSDNVAQPSTVDHRIFSDW